MQDVEFFLCFLSLIGLSRYLVSRKSMTAIVVAMLSGASLVGEAQDYYMATIRLSSFVDGANRQHVIYAAATDNNKLHQYVYNGSWSNENLSELAGSPSSVRFDTGITSFSNSNDEYIFNVEGDGHVHQLHWDGNEWADQDISTLAGANAWPALGTGISSFGEANGQEHVFYAGNDNNVHQLFWDGTHWIDQNLSSLANSGVIAPGTDLTSFLDSNGEHVFYIGEGAGARHIHQLIWNGNNWADQDLMNASSSNTHAQLGTSLSSFVDSSGEHIFFASDDNFIHQLFWNGNNWFEQSLPGKLVNTKAGISSFHDSFGEHVFYISSDYYIHQLYWNGSTWADQNLLSRAEEAAVSGFASPDGEHVYFVDGGNHLHQLFWNSTTNVWDDQILGLR